MADSATYAHPNRVIWDGQPISLSFMVSKWNSTISLEFGLLERLLSFSSAHDLYLYYNGDTGCMHANIAGTTEAHHRTSCTGIAVKCTSFHSLEDLQAGAVTKSLKFTAECNRDSLVQFKIHQIRDMRISTPPPRDAVWGYMIMDAGHRLRLFSSDDPAFVAFQTQTAQSSATALGATGLWFRSAAKCHTDTHVTDEAQEYRVRIERWLRNALREPVLQDLLEAFSPLHQSYYGYKHAQPFLLQLFDSTSEIAALLQCTHETASPPTARVRIVRVPTLLTHYTSAGGDHRIISSVGDGITYETPGCLLWDAWAHVASPASLEASSITSATPHTNVLARDFKPHIRFIDALLKEPPLSREHTSAVSILDETVASAMFAEAADFPLPEPSLTSMFASHERVPSLALTQTPKADFVDPGISWMLPDVVRRAREALASNTQTPSTMEQPPAAIQPAQEVQLMDDDDDTASSASTEPSLEAEVTTMSTDGGDYHDENLPQIVYPHEPHSHSSHQKRYDDVDTDSSALMQVPFDVDFPILMV